MLERLTTYQIAVQDPGSEKADLLKIRLAALAVKNSTWCDMYDEILSGCDQLQVANMENIATRRDTHDEYEPVLLTTLELTSGEAIRPLVELVEVLAPSQGVSEAANELDRLAAVIAAEIWLAALLANHPIDATSKGPDALNSIGAILARASGSPVPSMPFDPSLPSMRFALHRVVQAARRGRLWLGIHHDASQWEEIAFRVVTDLSYGAGGNSKTHDAALFLGHHILEIGSDDH